MEDQLNNLKSHASRIALTADEKSAGREILRTYMSLTPIRSAQVSAVRSRDFGFSKMLFSMRTASVFGLVLVMTFAVGGVSYAAEGALPGDALYGVKVGVNEQVRAAMASTDEDRAKWADERAERRLDEAEALIQKGTLKTATSVQLDEDFQQQVTVAQSSIAKIQNGPDAGAAVDVSARLEGSLRAHKKIFAALLGMKGAGNGNGQVSDAKSGDNVSGALPVAAAAALPNGVSVLTSAIDTEAANAEQAGKKSADSVMRGNAAAKTGAAQGRRKAAEGAIAEVRALLASKSSTLDQASQTAAGAQLDQASALVSGGDAKLAVGDVSGAVSVYAQALRTAQEAKLLVGAVHQFKVNVNFSDDDGERGDGGATSAPQTVSPQAGTGDSTARTPSSHAVWKSGSRHEDDGVWNVGGSGGGSE